MSHPIHDLATVLSEKFGPAAYEIVDNGLDPRTLIDRMMVCLNVRDRWRVMYNQGSNPATFTWDADHLTERRSGSDTDFIAAVEKRNNRLPDKFASAEHVAGEIVDEFIHAREKHKACNSFHEHYAVLLEEVDEYWEEVRKNSTQRSKKRIREELIQVAAMALAGIVELCDE